MNLTPDDMIELVCTGMAVLQSARNVTNYHESDNENSLKTSIDLEKDEQAIRHLSLQIEKDADKIFSTNKRIGEKQVTLIVDSLSEEMRKIH